MPALSTGILEPTQLFIVAAGIHWITIRVSVFLLLPYRLINSIILVVVFLFHISLQCCNETFFAQGLLNQLLGVILIQAEFDAEFCAFMLRFICINTLLAMISDTTIATTDMGNVSEWCATEGV